MFINALVDQVKKKKGPLSGPFIQVRVIGLEPTCLAAPDPKSGASANFATPAVTNRQNRQHRESQNIPP